MKRVKNIVIKRVITHFAKMFSKAVYHGGIRKRMLVDNLRKFDHTVKFHSFFTSAVLIREFLHILQGWMFSQLAKLAFSIYCSGSLSVSWKLNQYSLRLCRKFPRSEPAHHWTRTLDLLYERPMLYLCRCSTFAPLSSHRFET